MDRNEQRRAQRIESDFQKLIAELERQDAEVAELVTDNEVTEAELADAEQIIAPHIEELNEVMGFEEASTQKISKKKQPTPSHPFVLRV